MKTNPSLSRRFEVSFRLSLSGLKASAPFDLSSFGKSGLSAAFPEMTEDEWVLPIASFVADPDRDDEEPLSSPEFSCLALVPES